MTRVPQALARPDLICLDVDGCLIDTHTSFDNVVKTLVRRYTNSEASDAELLEIRRLGGYNDDNLLAWEIIRRRGVEVALDEIFPAFHELYFGSAETPGLYRSETPIITSQLLSHLLSNYNVALITGRNRAEVALAQEMLNLPADLPMWTIDDVQRGKPDPEGILAAKTRFAATTTWMVGDNVDDILAAKAAGAVAIGVGRYREALQQAGADILLDDINGLEALL